MLKEYLERVDLENSEELNKLQNQMKNLLDELNDKQELIDKLSREKNLDINIFSPRSIDTEADEKIEKAKKEKLDLNQRIEYVRGLIETYTQKKIEYDELRKELEKSEETDLKSDDLKSDGLKQNKSESAENITDTENFQITEEIENETYDKSVEKVPKESESSDTEETVQPGNLSVELEKSPVSRPELLDFLNDIYRQTELCLAIASNHNRCKTELRSLKNKIKKYAAKIENKD